MKGVKRSLTETDVKISREVATRISEVYRKAHVRNMVSRISLASVPDELYFLCMLHNIGATTSKKSLTLEEISYWTLIEPEKVKENLRKLMEGNYIQSSLILGVQRYFLSVDGIRTVLSMYS